METNKKEVERVTIEVPRVTGDQAGDCSELVERLVDKYDMSTADTDALFNAMVAIYIRGRMVYGDRQPSVCSLGAACHKDEAN